MKRALFVLLAFAVSFGSISCGGGTPTSPSPNPNPNPQPQKTTFTVVRLDNSNPVPGAQFILGAQTFTTNASGQVEVDPPATTTEITVNAPGFLKRETLAGKGTTVTLFPLVDGITEEYIRQLFYEDVDSSRVTPYIRPKDGDIFCLVLPPEFHSATLIEEAKRGVEGDASGFGNLTVSVTTDTAPSGCIVVNVHYRPDATATTGGPVVEGVRIIGGHVFFHRMPSYGGHFEWVIAHEFGHVLGLHHLKIPGEPGLMSDKEGRNSLTQREIRAIRLMLRRPPGNIFPDNDRNVQ